MDKQEKIATRVGFGDEIVEVGRKNKDVYVLDADIGKSCKTGKFSEALPEQYVDVGIAEQDAANIAAGLATTGKIPFVVTYAVFGSMRMIEQIRQEICYPKLNVKIACSHGGLTPANDGASHQCIEDIGIFRTIPNMTIVVPADYNAARKLVAAAAQWEGPVYLRFGRLAIPVFNDTPDYKFEIGKGIVLKEGKDVAVFATGLEVSEVIKAEEMLAKDGIDAEIINIHTIKPIDAELVAASATKTGKVVTVEEHSVIGGLGSAVCDVLCEKAPTKVMKIGVNDVFGESGPAPELIVKYGLDAESIYKKIKAFVKEN